MLLFLMTGLAIVVYLNQTPLQPRERDYAYAGSFYAFAIWIGMGVGMISEKVKVKSGKYATIMAVLSAIACLLVPIQMVTQTWDDHDRSDRYTCRDFGANYLNSMQREGHPIILTNGDNDTFPLWYNHEVEGVRTDTRVVNMEYLQTDWYIDQMKRPAYESLFKNELMILDMLLQANWERPIYMSISMGSDILPFLRNHLVLEGLAYRISPTATNQKIDVERLYDNIMHRFRYGGLSTKGIYVDEDVKRMANTHQLIMGVLIDSLLQHGDLKRALSVCHKWQKEMPQENVPYTEYALSMARCYYMAHQPEQGDEIVSSLLRRSDEWLSWINTIKPSRRAGSLYNRYTWMQTMEQALVVAEQFERTEFIHQYIKQYECNATL